MDPAATLCTLSQQGALLGQHRQLLQALIDNSTHVVKDVIDLTQQVTLLVASTLQPTAPAASTVGTSQHATNTYVCDLDPFHGDLVKCREFLLQDRKKTELWGVFHVGAE